MGSKAELSFVNLSNFIVLLSHGDIRFKLIPGTGRLKISWNQYSLFYPVNSRLPKDNNP